MPARFESTDRNTTYTVEAADRAAYDFLYHRPPDLPRRGSLR